MTKQATSFRLSTHTLTLLKQLAESENRSLTNMVETLIQERAKKDNGYIPFDLIGRFWHPSFFQDKAKEKGPVK